MKVSFTLGAGQDIRINNISSRVLTENLNRNPNFDVTFLNYNITSHLNTDRKIPEFMDKMEKHPILRECFTGWFNLFKVSWSNYHHVDFLLNELKTEYLFFSCSLLKYEFYQIAQILNHGVKVIIGGALLNTHSFKEARDIISTMVEEKYMKNLLIIKGYVDLTTDLYKIVQKWEDFEITKNDFSTFWECTDDYITDKIKRLQKFEKHIDLSSLEGIYPYRYSVFILDNKCWWGKCRFCIYPFFNQIDFTGGASVNKISDNIITTVRNHGKNSIFFANDYFQFTPKYKQIMQNLVDEDIRIVIFSGIQSLQNKEFLDNVNKYVSSIKLGLESFSDFSLKYINKGYTYAEIQNTLKLIKNHLNKDIFFLTNLIVDLPINSKEEIIRNYERAWEFKKEMIDAGFKFNYSSKILTVGNDTREQFIDNKFIKVDYETDNISGRYLLFKYFREMGVIKDDLYKDMSLPLLRFDENGNELSTDFNYIDFKTAKNTFRWIP